MGVLRWRKDSRSDSAPSSPSTRDEATNKPETTNIHGTEVPTLGPREVLEAALRCPRPYQTLVLPPGGGYWIEEQGCEHPNAETPVLEVDETCSAYRNFFMGKDHCNLISDDALLSVRCETDSTRLLLRIRSGTRHVLASQTPTGGPANLARLCSPDVSENSNFVPVMCPQAGELIAAYDEHAVSRTFKFGVLEQKLGQTTEEEVFSNRDPSEAQLEFLNILGNTVKLSEHKGYRGGLDTQFGHTGEKTVYRVFQGRELMFHVSGFLPYNHNDQQQLQRKRHIGNDIVAIVFQDENTPFAPDMIASHFLHVFIIVQPIRSSGQPNRYRVKVVARDGVPKFGPALPPNGEFNAGSQFQEWLLTKLINAEIAACKAKKFASLEERTRSLLLATLLNDLHQKTSQFLGSPPGGIVSPSGRRPSTELRGFMDTFRRAIRVRSHSTPSPPHAQQTLPRIKRKSAPEPPPNRERLDVVRSPNGEPWVIIGTPNTSPQMPSHRVSLAQRLQASESDSSSVGSSSDTGLESMSSDRPTGPDTCATVLTEEIARLKCDKLDLLRNNVVCQREVKILRERAMQLQSELALASRELLRMRAVIRECADS